MKLNVTTGLGKCTPARGAKTASRLLGYARQRAMIAGLGLFLAVMVPSCRRPHDTRRVLPSHVQLQTLRQTYGEALYSQDDEETLIRAFFRDRRGGVFLDVGAGDPVEHSTTYYLERHLGWSGIAVDALAEYAEAYAQKRPGTRFANYFVSDKSDTIRDFFASESRDFSSAAGADPRGGAYQKRKVPTITLNDLLVQEKATHIDFLSMDIEGAEPMALAGLDLGRHAPELACIEISSPESARFVAEYFTLRGCREVNAYRSADWINRYYTCR